MLVGHGRELVREKDDCLGAGIDSWTLFSQPHPLVRFLSDGQEVQVTGRSYHAQDHEGVPHESIRCASIEEVREFH